MVCIVAAAANGADIGTSVRLSLEKSEILLFKAKKPAKSSHASSPPHLPSQKHKTSKARETAAPDESPHILAHQLMRRQHQYHSHSHLRT
jgi:hypothetical protein